MKKLFILNLLILILVSLHLARDIYRDYAWAKCEEASLRGELGPCSHRGEPR